MGCLVKTQGVGVVGLGYNEKNGIFEFKAPTILVLGLGYKKINWTLMFKAQATLVRK